MRRLIKTWFFDLIRVFFVPDWDRNEDYKCMWCSEPVLKRNLYCSTQCSELCEKELTNHDSADRRDTGG